MTTLYAGLNASFESRGGETLVLAAYRKLRHDIIRGVRKPGERLRIERLKSIYGIGPTPLREALQKLSVEQLVVFEGNRGFTVSPLIVEEFEDLNIARIAIEKEAIRLSVAHGDDHWEAQVVATSYLLKKEDGALMAKFDRVPDSWESANAAFHQAIVAACGSNCLLRMRAGLGDLCERYRRASIYQKQGERNLLCEHAKIADAVLDRNADLACVLIEQHFALTAQSLAESAELNDNVNASLADV